MQGNARQILPPNWQQGPVAVVVPAFNEGEGIAQVVAELRESHVSGAGFEFVVIDDGSSDDTRDQAMRAGASVLSLPFNLGIGLAVQTGFRHALAQGAGVVVQVDGDGQHIPAEIDKLLAPLFSGHADVVVGSRYLRGAAGRKASTFARWVAGRALSGTIRLLTGARVTDPTSGFRAFARPAAEFVAKNYPDDYPEVQVLVALAKHGFRVLEVPVRMRSRRFGRSSINWWRSAYYMIKVTFACFVDRVRR